MHDKRCILHGNRFYNMQLFLYRFYELTKSFDFFLAADISSSFSSLGSLNFSSTCLFFQVAGSRYHAPYLNLAQLGSYDPEYACDNQYIYIKLKDCNHTMCFTIVKELNTLTLWIYRLVCLCIDSCD